MASKIGVLNCHMGILPNYRGMDIIQWAILEKRLDLIGLSCHIMTEKIDEGPIVSNLNIDISKLENIGEKRNLIEANMPKFLLDNIFPKEPLQNLHVYLFQNNFLFSRLFQN